MFGLMALLLSACSGGGETPTDRPEHISEVNLPIPEELLTVSFFGGSLTGLHLLIIGMVICLAGFAFGVVSYLKLQKLPVHRSMKEISDLIYETCKAYLVQQGKFLLILFAFIGAVIAIYFGFLEQLGWGRVLIVLLFSVVGMAGSYGIAWYGIRLNTFANSRTAHAALPGKPYSVSVIPLRSGMSIGMVLISTELIMMLIILSFLPREIAGSCFIGFAIGESLGASALRIAGGIFTKIADVGSDLMKIIFKIGEDDPRNPGTIADCTGDNAGDSVGPSADGFETYGVTGVALVTFILLAVPDTTTQANLLIWIFFIRAIMLVASGISYAVNTLIMKSKFSDAEEMEFETPLTALVWITSIVSIVLTFIISALLIPNVAGNPNLWWQLSLIISFGTLAGAIIPELVKVFTGVKAKHVEEVVKSAKEGGASLDILSGLVSGNFSAYWIGFAIIALMGGSYIVSLSIPDSVMLAPSVFALGLVAFGFLGMGPVTIAVDSYGPVTDNAQSVYELSRIESVPDISNELKNDFGIEPRWDRAKYLLEAGDGAGNTFKATAKPVLIGTAAVGATTMIFSIIVALTDKLNPELVSNLSLLHTPFLLGLLTGGAIIYWFSGASMQAVTTGAFRAVEYIKNHIKLDTTSEKASVE
ncbi:MAG: sodium-translocating pyrophosphatase, partial [Propionibacteriaceae bacterium]|nr:sodium-translocating pyrophosphatase [Propionibacteriaceae bacterium]